MRKFISLAIFAGLLAGCQTDPDTLAPGPSLNPPTYAYGTTPKPMPGNSSSKGGTAKVTQGQDTPASKTPVGSISKAWVPTVAAKDWDYIVVHHSDTAVGSAKAFDNAHRARGWECLGYDFVIGNGTYTRDGEIEVGQRWSKQMVGAHAGVAYYNEKGIGICLVGNFMETRPTAAQMQSLAKLTAYLMKTYHIAPDHVIGHRDAKKNGTLCPGKYMDLAVVRRMSSQYALIDSLDNAEYQRFAFDENASVGIPDTFDELAFDESQQVDYPSDDL